MIAAIINQKGGVGKTTTAINLGAYLANEGKRVLLIDLDPQANTTSGVGIHTDKISKSIYDVLIQRSPIVDAIHPTVVDNLHIVPSITDLAAIEVELAPDEEKHYYLKRVLSNFNSVYDFILIDCPPALGILTVNALTAASNVIIPLQCEYFALEGLTRLLTTIQMVKESLNPQLKLSGILLTMFDSRTILSTDVQKEAKKYFGNKIYDTYIPRNVRLSESPSHGIPIMFYAPTSKGAIAYSNLAKEVLASG